MTANPYSDIPGPELDDDVVTDLESQWEPVDLTPAWNGERVEPEAVVLRRSDGVYLLPAGVNYLYGDSGDGKSWVALFATYQLLRDGHHVVWITYEDTNELEVVKRLKALGVTDDERLRLHLIIATEALTTGIGALGRRIRSTGAHLVVLDSTGEANAEEGVNEDSDHEWGQWARSTLRRLIDIAGDPEWENARGTPVNDWVAELPIDHSTKARDGSFFPSGTKRKRAMVTGRMFMMNVRQAFAVGQIGRVQLVAAKDRTGVFRRGEIAAEIVLDATEIPYVFSVETPAAGSEMASGKRRPATERVLAVLLDTEKALTASEVHRIVNTDAHRLPGEGEMALSTAKNTLTKLDKLPGVRKVVEETGVGSGVRHTYKAVSPGSRDAA
jgi:hypothetical protein